MISTQPTVNGTALERKLAEAEAENARLRALVEETERQLRAAEKQRDKYHEFTKAWIAQNCPLSDWDDFDPAEYTEDFHPFFEKLIAEFDVK